MNKSTSNINNQKFSIRNRLKNFKYAIAGIQYMLKTQHNSWIHIAATIIVVILGIVFNISLIDWCILIFAIGFVLIAEIFNTAIEKIVDFISPNYNKNAGIIKDLAAGGVLISAIISIIIGIIVFLPKILLLYDQ